MQKVLNIKPSESYKIKGADGASFNMRWVPEDEQVEFIVRMKAQDAWLGLILGATPGKMIIRQDIIVFHAQGEQTHFKDYLCAGERTPVADLSNDIHDHPDHSVEYDEASGMVTVFARRPLETTDKTDFVIQLDKQFILGYAYSGQSSDFMVSGKH